VVAVFYGLIMLVSAPVVSWIDKAPDIGRSIQSKLQLLDAPLAGLRDMRNALLPSQAGKGFDVDFVAVAQSMVTIVTPALGADPDLLRHAVFYAARPQPPPRRAGGLVP
jgi:hypothetical protein